MPMIRREDSEGDVLNLQDLPAAGEQASDADSLFVADEGPRRSKRARNTTAMEIDSSPESSPAIEAMEPRAKRRKDADLLQDEDQGDDKKKMAMSTTYEGFAIYGSVLCLVVKRKDKKGKVKERSEGQAMMEDWIASTQMPAGEEDGS